MMDECKFSSGDYAPVSVDNPILHGVRKLVTAKAGDLLLWDSRTIHCNSPATKIPETSTENLLRAVAYICMTPEASVTVEGTTWQRKRAYEMGITTSHWPHYF